MTSFFDKKPVKAISDAIQMFGEEEFQSPFRSTVPLLSWLINDQPMLNSVLHEMGIPANCNLHLEYQVVPQLGIGKPSHTDLMVISDDYALAVEAKWTEPRYETVAAWLKGGSKPLNRSNVMVGWLSLLQNHAKRQLFLDDFSDVIYQMVHRAASACAVNKRPALAYLLFKPSPDPKSASSAAVFVDLKHFWEILGCPRDFPFFLIEVTLFPTELFKALSSLKKARLKQEKMSSLLCKVVIPSLHLTIILFRKWKRHNGVCCIW